MFHVIAFSFSIRISLGPTSWCVTLQLSSKFSDNNKDWNVQIVLKWQLFISNYIYSTIYTFNYLFSYFSHNDLPWNIRKFIHNKLNTVNFSTVLSTINPWSESQWSHTDLYRLNKGNVGGQVIKKRKYCTGLVITA